ncbi:MAG: cysteine synthase family protein [Bacillales bacterium]|nr:cysteine synthase family protein [Bacillales bacterium]
MIYENIGELVGKTPLVKFNKIASKSLIYGKLEKTNPAGSVKDRIVYEILSEYFKDGTLKKGSVVIEPTSGNTGIALACFSNYFDFKTVIVMPSSASIERRNLIEAYGGELILVNGGMKDCVKKAEEIKNETKESIIFGQFETPLNPLTHYNHTAREIYDDLADVYAIVSGIGTGGTITGIGKYFKEIKPEVRIIGVEPKESPLLSEGFAAPHKIQGIGANFIPHTLNLDYVDEIIEIEGDAAIETAVLLRKKEGYLVGISSGAALKAALILSERKEYENKKIVVILPDTGERYTWTKTA